MMDIENNEYFQNLRAMQRRAASTKYTVACARLAIKSKGRNISTSVEGCSDKKIRNTDHIAASIKNLFARFEKFMIISQEAPWH
jgi:hypothetical protein